MPRIPFTVLSEEVNSPTNQYGDVFDLAEVLYTHSIQITVADYSGSGTLAVDLNGSLDGENWYMVVNFPNGVSENGTWIFTTTTPVPARYLQAYGVQYSGTPVASVTVVEVSS